MTKKQKVVFWVGFYVVNLLLAIYRPVVFRSAGLRWESHEELGLQVLYAVTVSVTYTLLFFAARWLVALMRRQHGERAG